MTQRRVWTIGHSDREFSGFLELLGSENITAVADVRRFPGSRRCPQFNRDAMQAALAEAGLSYRHFAELGGRRTSQRESSPNTAWRVEAFRAYADYMLTREFQEAFASLTAMAERTPTALLCAEALPWRCHRRLIADQLLAEGWLVWDIIDKRQVREHALPSFAKVVDGRVTYPSAAP